MPTINQLPSIDQVSGGNQIPTYYSGSGDARKMSVSLLQEYMQENLSFPGVASNASGVNYNPAGAGAVTRTVEAKLREQVSIFDFMTSAEIADVQAGTLLVDCAAAFNTALAASKNIYFPPGKYRFNSTITINGARGLILRGAAAALLASGTGYTGTTELYFNNAPPGSNGIVFNDFTGVTISDLSIVMRRGGAGGGKGLYLYNGHDYSLRNIKVDMLVGSTGTGIHLGNGSGATSTFVGNISNCKVMAGTGAGIYANFGTSLTFTACYVIGGYTLIAGMAYCSLNGCAVDAAPNYAYAIDGSTNIGIYACGAEAAGKGAFYLSTTSSNIHIDSPYGAANNQSADATIGDLIHIDNSAGAVNSITITNPTSVSPNAATVQNIYSNAGGGFVEVLNTDLTLLSLGIGGHSTWLREKLTVTGYWDQLTSWTPVLSGWTNAGSPTVVGKYKRVGKVVTFYVNVEPSGGGSISATRPTSTITGFPFTSVASGSATMTDGNALGYSACALSSTGIIYPQTSGVLTVGLSFVGTVILP